MIFRSLVFATALLFAPAASAATLDNPWGATATDLPPPVTNTSVWKPTTGLSWQLQYINRLDTSVRADVYKIDLFDTRPETIATLKAGGKRAVCYLNAGAWEDWRADAGDFTEIALGNAYEGWPGERWIDIRNFGALAPVMLARLDLCRDKGFDGVMLDNVNSYTHRTGFPLSAVDQLRYNTWLANEAHTRGLAVGMNNNAEQARELAPYFDWALAEGCLSGGWCQSLRPFSELGKPVVVIEYTDSRTRLALFCHQASVLRVSVLVKKRALDAYRMDCRTFPTRAAL